jgi:bacteriorhodopsin
MKYEKTFLIICGIALVWYKLLGLFAFYNSRKESKITAGVLSGFICLFNSFCMLIYILKLKYAYVFSFRITYIRYIEWIVCNPLMIYQICLSSDVSQSESFVLCMLVMAYCICGILCSLTSRNIVKTLLTLEGCVYCVIVVFRLLQLTSKNNEKGRIAKTARVNLIMCCISYPLYVLTWGMGPEIFDVIPLHQELILESSLSLVLKTTATMYVMAEEYTPYISYFINSAINVNFIAN